MKRRVAPHPDLYKAYADSIDRLFEAIETRSSSIMFRVRVPDYRIEYVGLFAEGKRHLFLGATGLSFQVFTWDRNMVEGRA